MSNKQLKIFIAEDDNWYNKLLVHTLSLNPDFEIKSFFDGTSLLSEIEIPDIVTIDFRLPDMSGDVLLDKVLAKWPHCEVIIISEQNEIEVAVNLLKAGASDYLVKSNDIRDRLLKIINGINTTYQLRDEIISLKKEVSEKYSFQNTMLGNSKMMQPVFDLMQKACDNNITVTITGETGTGKEVAAKSIHYNSYCKQEPFVAINMAAIPKDLLESELFGHEKGAFTGAINKRIGKFEEAGKGTLFLDEIGEMDINFQSKLLRVLQEREVTRVGGNKTIPVHCRIMVATNKKLEDEVSKGNFRQDLFFRLKGLPIHLPPLRERGKDILMLAQHFIEMFCKSNQIAVKTLEENAIKKLLAYSWPGNIRELKSVIDLAVVLSNGNEIAEKDLNLDEQHIVSSILNDNKTMREYEQEIVQIYMSKYNDNTKIVAEKLGIGQTTVYRILKELAAKSDLYEK